VREACSRFGKICQCCEVSLNDYGHHSVATVSPTSSEGRHLVDAHGPPMTVSRCLVAACQKLVFLFDAENAQHVFLSLSVITACRPSAGVVGPDCAGSPHMLCNLIPINFDAG